jgi:hypothetical protein
MPSGSVKTYKSRSTARTASDVFDIIESRNIDSLREATKVARHESGRDSKLADDVISELRNPLAIFANLTTVPESLIKLMFETNTYLGGVQATSYQYAVCGVLDAPWDFFCSTECGDPALFVGQLEVLTLSEKIEHISSTEGEFDIYILRKSVNGAHDPITMRVFVSYDHPLASILDMKTTYQHSAISAVGAVCFWPTLLSAKPREYRVFSNNVGLNKYPTCQAKFKNRHTKITPASSPMSEQKRIYHGLSKTDSVMFDNVTKVDKALFSKRQSEMVSIVFAACASSTKYLGHTADM